MNEQKEKVSSGGQNSTVPLMMEVRPIEVPASYTSESSEFEGPLPSPDLLAGYEDVMPGATEAFFDMAREQQRHRFELDKSTAGMNLELVKNGRIGQYIGALLVVILTIAGTVCALMGRESVAQAIFITTIIGVAGIFVVDRISPMRKKTEKN